MLSALTALVALSVPPSPISPLEAIAVARWFSGCVEVTPPSESIHSRLDRHGWSRVYETPVYLVTFGKSGSKTYSLFVIVDSVSGHVVHADSSLKGSTKRPQGRVQTDKWLRRLGLANRMTPKESFLGRYDYAIQGKPFMNLNGYTSAHFMTRGSEFARYVAPGEMPPPPMVKPKIPAANAAVIGSASRRKRIPNWPEQLEARTSLGPFYDEESKSTKWVWKVEEGSTRSGNFHASFTSYVDAVTGNPISDNRIQLSRFMYRSFPPRSGLAKVNTAKLPYPILDLALRKLNDFGRSDLHFDSIEIASGVRMKREYDTEVEFGPTGKLLSLKAPTEAGVLDQGRALPKGINFIRAQTSSLPEGKFLAAKSRLGNFTRVLYRQTALGYEFLDSEVVYVDYNSKGKIANFKVNPAAAHPEQLPARILSSGEIEARAMALAKPRLKPDTSTVSYSARARVGKLGWFVPNSTGRARLAFSVEIWFMSDFKGRGGRGSGRAYHFDAETGSCLEKFP